MTSGLSPARRRFVVVLAALGAIVVVVVAATVYVRGRGSTVHPVSQQQLGPVLLVPGFGGSTTGVTALAVRLRATGRTAVVVALPDGGTGDLRVQARALGTAVKKELAATHAPSVDVIGYSAGGVVTRLWIRDDGGASLTRRVVTLGSPQHGTDLAALAGSLLPGACPTACQQLESSSDILAELNAGDETPKGPTFVSIYTTHDDVVVPPESAELDGALNMSVQSVCASSTVNHSSLPTDHLVQSMVLAELAAGSPVTAVVGRLRAPQLVMSLVEKFAQAAARNTPT